jgi:hypothetical protein
MWSEEQQQIPCGNDNKGKSRSLRDDNAKDDNAKK